jgi:CRP-like cAMP-binding protein
MIERFEKNPKLRLEEIAHQTLVDGNVQLAAEIDVRGELMVISAGSHFIEQGDETNDMFLILAGTCDVVVNGQTIAKRGPRSHVGEMAAVQPTQRRAATCTAAEDMVVIKITEPDLSVLGGAHPQIFGDYVFDKPSATGGGDRAI